MEEITIAWANQSLLLEKRCLFCDSPLFLRKIGQFNKIECVNNLNHKYQQIFAYTEDLNSNIITVLNIRLIDMHIALHFKYQETCLRPVEYGSIEWNKRITFPYIIPFQYNFKAIKKKTETLINFR